MKNKNQDELTEITEHQCSQGDRSRRDLQANCVHCFGICCVALFFSKSDGFPTNKDAGTPCTYLASDFRCSVHERLEELGCQGCIAFDCFGAGQKMAQVSFQGQDWRTSPATEKYMVQLFSVMRQLHEMLWYLTEAQTYCVADPVNDAIRSMLKETELLTQSVSDALLCLDIAAHRAKVNALLLKTSELIRAEESHNIKSKQSKLSGRRANLAGADLRKTDLRGADLRGTLLIAANLQGANFSRTDFIGADFRDANVKGADFSRSLFLTQAQINVAKGDVSTKLPPFITKPEHWL